MKFPSSRTRPAKTIGAARFNSPQLGNTAAPVPSWAHDKKPRTTQRRSGAASRSEPEVEVADSGSLRRLRTVNDMAEVLSVSPKTVRRMIDDGQIHAVRVRRSLRVTDAEYR